MMAVLSLWLVMGLQSPLEQARQAIVHEQFAEARALLVPLAEKGEAEAQYLLGHLIDGGWGGPQDPAGALSWWLRAAEQNHGEALFRAGLAYLYGRGVDPDENRALELLEQAAMLGHHGAELALGKALLLGVRGPGHVPTAILWLSCAAAAGNQEAAEIVGTVLAKGTEETVPDLPRAVKFLRLAEALGSAQARSLLNELDPAKEAQIATEQNVHLLWESARLGFPDAQFRLAVLGLANVPWGPSRAEALQLLATAAANGHPEACYRWLQFLRQQGPVDPLMEEQLLRTAVTGGFTAATWELGQCLARRRAPEAVGWLRTALQAGQSQAGLELARIFLEGKLTPRDTGQARQLLVALKGAEDPEVRRQAARLLLTNFHDRDVCSQALELDPQAVCPPSPPSPTSPPASLP